MDTNVDLSYTVPTNSLMATKSPLISSVRDPQETCFFWYHGECRRGDKCSRPHETHITWPITTPKGYVHWKPCVLPLCPLRKDLIALMEGEKYSAGEGVTEGGRVVTEELTKGSVSQTELLSDDVSDTSPSASGASSSASFDSRLDTDIGTEGAIDMATITISSSSSEDSLESCPTPNLFSSSPYSVGRGLQTISISHIGTVCNEPHPPHIDTAQPSISNKPHHPNSSRENSSPNLSHKTLEKSGNPPQSQITTPQHAPSLCVPPRAPRVLKEHTGICFFWYHRGYCQPKRKSGGYPASCNYLHTLDTPIQQVGLPPGITNHNPHCPLPLCPIYPKAQNKMDLCNGAMNRSAPAIKVEAGTPPRLTSMAFANSDRTPRREITAARINAGVKGPKFNTTRTALPHLTGHKRERFEYQRKYIEDWQAENDTKPSSITQPANLGKNLQKMANKRKRGNNDTSRNKQSKAEMEQQRTAETRQHRKRKRKNRKMRRAASAEVGPKGQEIQNSPWFLSGFPSPNMPGQKKNAEEEATQKSYVVLVDYRLPEGENRADWDTDFLRRAFGEIE